MLTVASTKFSMRDLQPRQETESLPLPRGVATAQAATGIVPRWVSLIVPECPLPALPLPSPAVEVVPFDTLKGHRDDERCSFNVDAPLLHVSPSPFTFPVLCRCIVPTYTFDVRLLSAARHFQCLIRFLRFVRTLEVNDQFYRHFIELPKLSSRRIIRIFESAFKAQVCSEQH